ncbi:MAG: alpha/beta hydrolase [Pseudomonadota bacterium]
MWRGALFALLIALLGCAIADNAVDRTQMSVEGSQLFISGEITSRTPGNFRALLAAHPEVRTIVPLRMSGSSDETATYRIGYLIRDSGLDTRLTPGSEIYSGAVSLFIAGNRRTAASGAVVGVHSWADGFGEGTSYPRQAGEHAANVDYTRDMLGSDAFYWFTLAAAPSTDIHIMTRAELQRFGILTP